MYLYRTDMITQLVFANVFLCVFNMRFCVVCFVCVWCFVWVACVALFVCVICLVYLFVCLFGSSVNGFHSYSSDIDVLLEAFTKSQAPCWARKSTNFSRMMHVRSMWTVAAPFLFLFGVCSYGPIRHVFPFGPIWHVIICKPITPSSSQVCFCAAIMRPFLCII